MLKKIISVFAVVFALGAYVLPQAASAASKADNHVVFQINSNDKGLMNLVLNNAENVKSEYSKMGKSIEIEVVAYGPGLAMLTAKSPVAARIQNISANGDDITFAACNNTMKKMEKKSGKPVQLLEFSNVKVVPAGVVRIMELQNMGWNYIKP
ncbi:MAG: DsrE family protein [Rhodospirillaceae bacterium]|nr:DsrE family protein [Rhodospirillaceae bacterium]